MAIVFNHILLFSSCWILDKRRRPKIPIHVLVFFLVFQTHFFRTTVSNSSDKVYIYIFCQHRVFLVKAICFRFDIFFAPYMDNIAVQLHLWLLLSSFLSFLFIYFFSYCINFFQIVVRNLERTSTGIVRPRQFPALIPMYFPQKSKY